MIVGRSPQTPEDISVSEEMGEENAEEQQWYDESYGSDDENHDNG
jgi:hypothetical protein